MRHLTIKNIGPIKEVNIDLNNFIFVIGPQSSGKSTIGKILCHCQWVEKKCSLDDSELVKYRDVVSFMDSLKSFHRLEGYFSESSEIDFVGDYIHIYYSKTAFILEPHDYSTEYEYPKICYIPAERNLIAAIPNLQKYNDSNDLILYFMYDWFDARSKISNIKFVDFFERAIEYVRDENDYIIDDGHKILLKNASSGVQSILPLYSAMFYSLVILQNIDIPLTPEQKQNIDKLTEMEANLQNLLREINAKDLEISIKQKVKEISDELYESKEYKSFSKLLKQLDENKKSKYKCANLFIEEPEQNIFPIAQRKILNYLLELDKKSQKNNFYYITTHSPFILFALNNSLMGGLVENKIPDNQKKDYTKRVKWIDPKKVSVYEIHDGYLKCIQDDDGTLQDNYLNKAYKEISSDFINLLNYYDESKN